MYNPRKLELTPEQYTALELLVAEIKEQLLVATREAHRHAEEWAALRIEMGDYELNSNRSAPVGGDGATVTVYDPLIGNKVVVILPGEYAPYDVAIADRRQVLQSGNERILAFFASL